MIFKSIKNILSRNNIYELKIDTITTDTELALINAIHINFPNTQRNGYWFHFKQDLMREDKILGLLKNKNRKINPQITLDIISQISKLSLYYNNGIKYIENYIKNIIS